MKCVLLLSMNRVLGSNVCISNMFFFGAHVG